MTGHHYITVRRTDGEVTDLECPKCGNTGIVLIEEILEWRELLVENGVVYAQPDPYAEGESKGFKCSACETDLNLTPQDTDVYSLLTYF